MIWRKSAAPSVHISTLPEGVIRPLACHATNEEHDHLGSGCEFYLGPHELYRFRISYESKVAKARNHSFGSRHS